jgi:predicted nucleic-acid-binding protein
MPAAGVDTNVFLRIFIQDDGPQHRAAVELVRSLGQVFVGTVVLVETVWALRKLYKFPRSKLVNFLNTILATDAFIIENREIVEAAMFGYSSGYGDFADHIILESARRNGADQMYTFDLDFSRVPGAVRLKD